MEKWYGNPHGFGVRGVVNKTAQGVAIIFLLSKTFGMLCSLSFIKVFYNFPCSDLGVLWNSISLWVFRFTTWRTDFWWPGDGARSRRGGLESVTSRCRFLYIEWISNTVGVVWHRKTYSWLVINHDEKKNSKIFVNFPISFLFCGFLLWSLLRLVYVLANGLFWRMSHVHVRMGRLCILLSSMFIDVEV